MNGDYKSAPTLAHRERNSMDKDLRIQATWHWPALIGLNLLAGLLLASWLSPATRPAWDSANLWVFQVLNGSLGHNIVWDTLWAVGSLRVFDILVGALMLCMTIHTGWVFSDREVRPALLHFLSLLALMLVARVIFSRLVSHFDWQHASPSVQLADAVHLSQQFPLLEQIFELKDRSSRSFPGDHASVLLLWGLFMALFARGWKLAASMAVVVLCCLPRLIAGAHWLVDVAAGGLMLALLAFAWGYCTPLASRMAAGLEWCLRPLLPTLARLPLFGRWALLQR